MVDHELHEPAATRTNGFAESPDHAVSNGDKNEHAGYADEVPAWTLDLDLFVQTASLGAGE